METYATNTICYDYDQNYDQNWHLKILDTYKKLTQGKN